MILEQLPSIAVEFGASYPERATCNLESANTEATRDVSLPQNSSLRDPWCSTCPRLSILIPNRNVTGSSQLMLGRQLRCASKSAADIYITSWRG